MTHDFIRLWLEANKDDTSYLRCAVTELLREHDRLKDELERVRLAQTLEVPDEETEAALADVERLRPSPGEVVVVPGPGWHPLEVLEGDAPVDGEFTPCKHERLDEDGVCRRCGLDCRGIH